MRREDYPPDWPAISKAVRARAASAEPAGRCECEGECGTDHAAEDLDIGDGMTPEPEARCIRRQGDPLGGYRVVLTVAHLWRGPCAAHHAAGIKCGDPSHLKAMCQRCHLAYDRPHHIARSRRTRHGRKASGDLFDP